MNKKEKKYLSETEALQKLQAYCAYQDRCHQEVRSKLISLGIYGDSLENIIIELIGDNFLNEERFARSFARGKFKFKKWGKIKITQELKRKNISAYCLKKAMEEIEEEEYLMTIDKLIEKKRALVKGKNKYEKKGKIARFVLGKGYESFIVWERINAVFED